MNAVGIAEQESGRAIGFFCKSCGRTQIPFGCHQGITVEELTEYHRKAELCCTVARCPRHDFIVSGWHHCQKCILEGPEGRAGEPMPEPVERKAASA